MKLLALIVLIYVMVSRVRLKRRLSWMLFFLSSTLLLAIFLPLGMLGLLAGALGGAMMIFGLFVGIMKLRATIS